MVSTGRISVLVSKDLQTLLSAIREIPREVNAELRKHTRIVAEPVWQEAVRANLSDRLETRVLGDTARAAVSDTNILLRSGGIGTTADGTPISELALPTEYGGQREEFVTVRNRQGTSFKRRTKRQFKLPRARGYVVNPAAREVIPRIVSLWVQTTVRTIHESFEKGGAR